MLQFCTVQPTKSQSLTEDEGVGGGGCTHAEGAVPVLLLQNEVDSVVDLALIDEDVALGLVEAAHHERRQPAPPATHQTNRYTAEHARASAHNRESSDLHVRAWHVPRASGRIAVAEGAERAVFSLIGQLSLVACAHAINSVS